MQFRSPILVVCHACGLEFEAPRAPAGAACVCPDCEAVNITPAAPPLPWGKALAIVLGLTLAGGIGYAVWWFEQRGSESVRLRAEALQEFKAKNYAQALACYERLFALDERPTADETFRFAQCLAATGERGRARRVVENIVEQAGTDWLPHTAMTFADAEFWLAQEIYTRPKITAGDWHAAEAYLRTVLLYSPQHETARRMLMKMQRATGQHDAALANLEKLAPYSTADRMELAQTYDRLGKRAAAADEARLVLASLLVDLGERPDDVSLRHTAAHAALLANDYGAAEQQLNLALKFGAGHEDLTMAKLAEVYERQASQLPHDRPDWDEQTLDLLKRSLEFAPRRHETYEAINPLLARPGKVAEEAHELLLTGIARGVEPIALHGLLAQWCSRTGRTDESIRHWRVVVGAEPTAVAALNNLAWELCWNRPPRLDEALSLVNRALQFNPGAPVLRETRGQILARAGRSREALADLLAAAPTMSDNARLHATLAEVYRDLNLTEEAKLHSARAIELAPETDFEPVRPNAQTPTKVGGSPGAR